MELFLIRHGQSGNNALADFSKRDKDPELTELGERQAAMVADFLAGKGHLEPAQRRVDRPALDRLYCSPMIRTMQTAQPIAGALGLQPEVWIEIHEMGGIYLDHGGERGTVGYPGQRRAEMEGRFPGFLIPPQVNGQGWWREERMERFHTCQGRAIGVAAHLKGRAAEEERIGLVTHGGFMSCLIHALGRQLPPDGLYFDHGNTGITRIELTPEWTNFRYVNRLEHLPADAQS